MTYAKDYELQDCIEDAFSELKFECDIETFNEDHLAEYLKDIEVRVTEDEFDAIYEAVLDFFIIEEEAKTEAEAEFERQMRIWKAETDEALRSYYRSVAV